MSLSNQPGTPRDDGEMGGNFLNPFQSESYSPSMTMSVWSITESPHDNHSESALHRTTTEENYSSQCTVKQRNLSHTKPTFLFPALSPILWRKRVPTWFEQLYGAAYFRIALNWTANDYLCMYMCGKENVVYVCMFYGHRHIRTLPTGHCKILSHDILSRTK